MLQSHATGFPWRIVAFLCLAIIAQGCSVNDKVHSGNQFSKKATEKEANELVVKFLKKEKLDWGSPVNVLKKNSGYYFMFFTPPDEARLKGPRVLVVNEVDGVVRYGPRF